MKTISLEGTPSSGKDVFLSASLCKNLEKLVCPCLHSYPYGVLTSTLPNLITLKMGSWREQAASIPGRLTIIFCESLISCAPKLEEFDVNIAGVESESLRVLSEHPSLKKAFIETEFPVPMPEFDKKLWTWNVLTWSPQKIIISGEPAQ